MKKILVVSSSTVHGSGYLDHCEHLVRRLFDGLRPVLFVPYAVHDSDRYAATAAQRFAEMGLELKSIHRQTDPGRSIERCGGMFVGGGNTFRLLRDLRSNELVEPIRRRVAAGIPYMGTSAGANVAGLTIKTTNDMPIVEVPALEALALVPFQLNPHYVDADPSSTHMGETRDTRLKEFHEENETPVVAIREGAMLWIEGNHLRVEGAPGGKLFRRGLDAVELSELSSLDFLLNPSADQQGSAERHGRVS